MSFSSSRKPALEPRLRMTGGSVTMTLASRILRKSCVAFCASARALWLGSGRSSQSVRRTKARADDWLPPRPVTMLMLRASGICWKYSVTCLATALVRSAVAPAGGLMMTVSAPWSSSGTKLVGSLCSKKAMPPPISR